MWQLNELGKTCKDLAYELETIESKITENIFLAASDTITFDVPEFLKELDSECIKVKKAFRHQVVSFENEHLVKRYFHFHQESLIDLINSIQTNTQSPIAEHLVESVINRLSGVLVYLEEHFPEYFDQDMKMPAASMKLILDELRAFVQSLTEKFSNCNVDIGLVELMKNAIDEFISSKRPISFRMFYYIKFLRIHLTNFRVEPGTETLDVIRVLMHCNFNEESFYNYMIRYIKWAVNKGTTVNEKLDELAFYLKFSNQETATNNLSYNHLSAPINIQIADWISQEAQYLKHKQQLAPSIIGAEDIVPSDFKLTFDLSVSMLAYLFRAFIESGVIQNKNVSELIRFLTKYAKTKRSESISHESFRIKYYSVENGTKDAVKKTLQSVLNFINKT